MANQKYKKGDWLIANNNMQLRVTTIEPEDYDGFIAKTIDGYCYGFSPDGKCVNPAIHEFNGMPVISIIRKLHPCEVVVDFSNGIKGVIRMSKYKYIVVYHVTPNGDLMKIATICLQYLTAPMHELVSDLLKSQREWKDEPKDR